MDTFVLHSEEPEIQKLLQALTIPHGVRIPTNWNGHAVIGWGKYRIDGHGLYHLQPVQSILRCANKQLRDATLHVNGLKTLSSHGHTIDTYAPRYPYYYIIPVFQLDALTVYRRKDIGLFMRHGGIERPEAYEDLGLDNPTYHVKRAVREAIKAIYALGLDYGVVTVGIPASGHTLILDVNPEPKLNRKLAGLYAEAIAKYDLALGEQIRNPQSVMLGADPEFLLLSEQGKVVAASHFVERAGVVGCDGVVNRGEQTLHPLAELRPQPSESPDELALHVQHALLAAAKRFSKPGLRWVAGGMPVPGLTLGGHIHLSRVMLNSHLLRALDNYLALPLLLAESEQSIRRRPRYGALGDFRRQPHGGFEYRTLPSWLASPTVARGAFALTKLIAEHPGGLLRRPLSDPDITAMYYRGDKQSLLPIVKVLWRDLESLPAYWNYAAELEALKQLLFRMQSWDELADFRYYWKIPIPSSAPLLS
jgi:Phage phiEco32-like COOH.NH2 ligase-type 2